jgi:uncharacterized protein (TIGR04255 family)
MLNVAPRKHYRNSPIEEVVCEFEFPDVKKLDLGFSSRIFDAMHALYPMQPQMLAPDPATSGDHGHGAKVRLSTLDAKWQVRCGDSAVSIHGLRPYAGWETYYDRVHHALRAFLTVAAPKTIAQINLRYRNAFIIPIQSLAMADYFTLGATIPHGLPTRFISYANAFRAAYDDQPRTVLSLSFTASPPPHGAKSGVEVTLDIMTSAIQLDEAAEIEMLLKKVSDLKVRAYDAFENVITDHTRKLLGRV